MTHKFKVGQTVLPAHPRRANPDAYVIVQVLPETSHDRQYRVRALSSAAECVVHEGQIKRSGAGSRPPQPAQPYEDESEAHLVWC